MKSLSPSRRFLMGLLPAILLLITGCTTPQANPGGQPPCCRSRVAETPPAGEASVADLEAVWETDSGRSVRLAELPGQVRVISMFYATCEGVCVITKEDMQAIEASLPSAIRGRVHFILVTLDGQHDTVEALRRYRRTQNLARERWTLLRGDDEATRRLAAVLGIGSGRDGTGRFVHSSELVVLDESGRIIHRHGGVRANLSAIVSEIEAAAPPKAVAQADNWPPN